MHTATHTVQTPAPAPVVEADLFGPAPTHRESPRIELVATLLSNAEVRTKQVGDGTHVCPVLCMELSTHTALHQTLHAEQVFTEATRILAEKLATTLKRGTQVRITTNLLDMHVRLPHVESIEKIV